MAHTQTAISDVIATLPGLTQEDRNRATTILEKLPTENERKQFLSSLSTAAADIADAEVRVTKAMKVLKRLVLEAESLAKTSKRHRREARDRSKEAATISDIVSNIQRA